MSADTKIEWATKTWNPVIGCTRISEGCRNCYAERVANRWQATGLRGYDGVVDKHGRWTGQLNMVKSALDDPLKWRKPQRIFVNSMSDLFHTQVSFQFIARIYGIMQSAKQHTYMILTKRPERAYEFVKWFRDQWLLRGDYEREYGHVWLGVSVENQDAADQRIPWLLRTPAAVRFISAEPLLGPLDMQEHFGSITDCYPRCPIDWVICGGESGPNARPMHPDWVRSLRDQCAEADVPFFFKQWGEWLPDEQFCDTGIEDNPEASRFRSMVFEDGKWSDLGYPIWTDFEDYYGYQIVGRVGKKAAGRLLDGVAHDAIPEARA